MCNLQKEAEMIELEFGDALRRLRNGESLVANHPDRNSMTFIWGRRGLLACSTSGKWVPVILERALDIVMTSTWYLPTTKPILPRKIKL